MRQIACLFLTRHHKAVRMRNLPAGNAREEQTAVCVWRGSKHLSSWTYYLAFIVKGAKGLQMFHRLWRPAALILIIVLLWRSNLGGSSLLGTQDLVSRLPSSIQNHTISAVQAGNRLLGQLPGTQDLVSRLPPSMQNHTISAVQAGQRLLDQLPGIKDTTMNLINNFKSSFKAPQFSLGGAASGNGGGDGTKSASASAAPLKPPPPSEAHQMAATTAPTSPPVGPAKATSSTRPLSPKEHGRLTARSPSTSQSNPAVPRSIHFINVSPNLKGISGGGSRVNGLSRKQKENVEGWRRLHPAPRWNVTVWDDSKVLSELPDLAPLLKRVPHPAWASNILRYSILERQGGLFLELDMAGVRIPPPLLLPPPSPLSPPPSSLLPPPTSRSV